MTVHSQPLDTARAILEEQEARWRQAWADYQESFLERLRHQAYVQSVYGQLHGLRGRFDRAASNADVGHRYPALLWLRRTDGA